MWGSGQGRPRALNQVQRIRGPARGYRPGEPGGSGEVLLQGDGQEEREKLGLGDIMRSLYSSAVWVKLHSTHWQVVAMISGQLLLPGHIQAIKPLKHLSETSTGQFSSDHIQEESGPIQAAFLRLTSDHWNVHGHWCQDISKESWSLWTRFRLCTVDTFTNWM